MADRKTILAFFRSLDRHLAERQETLSLTISGAAALILQYGGSEATKDIDTIDGSEPVLDELLAWVGKDTPKSAEFGVYLDRVPPIFPRAAGLASRTVSVEIAGLTALRIRVLDLHDLVISKLKRFHAGDRGDIEALCREPGFDPERLLNLFEDARALWKYERDILEAIDENFNRVRTEILGLPRISHWDDEH